MRNKLSFIFGAAVRNRIVRITSALLLSATATAAVAQPVIIAPVATNIQTLADQSQTPAAREIAIRQLVTAIRDKKTTATQESDLVTGLILLSNNNNAVLTTRSTALTALGDIMELRPVHAQAIVAAALPLVAHPEEILKKPVATLLKKIPTLGPQDNNVVAALTQLAQDKNLIVSRQALNAFEAHANRAGPHVPQFITVMAPLVTANDTLSRAYARNTLSIIAETYPAHADDALAPLLNAARQGLIANRKDALSKLGEIGRKNETLGAKIMPVMEEIAHDGSQEIRKLALDTVHKIALPFMNAHSTGYFLLLSLFTNDPDTAIRKAAVDSLAQTAIENKAHSAQAFAMMRDSLKTETVIINRRNAIQKIVNVGETHHEFAQQVMEVLTDATQDTTSPDERTAGTRNLTGMATRFPQFRPAIFAIFSARVADTNPSTANEAVKGMEQLARLDTAYAKPGYLRIKEILPVTDKMTLETAVRQMNTFAARDAALADSIMTDLAAMRNHAEYAIRNVAAYSISEVAIAYPHLAGTGVRHLHEMTRHADANTRRDALQRMTSIGLKADSQTIPVFQLLKNDILVPSHPPNFIDQAIAQVGVLAEAKAGIAPEAVQFLVPVAKGNTPGAAEAVRSMIRIAQAHSSLLPVVVPLLESLQTRPVIGSIIKYELLALRRQLDFQVLRNDVNREAEITAQRDSAINNPALASSLMPDAIILLKSPTATIRSRIADFIGHVGNAHGHLAGDAASALSSLAKDPDNNTRRAVVQGLGKIGLSHASTAHDAISALSIITEDSDSTIGGMAVTGIGLIGQRYPAASAEAVIALEKVEKSGNTILARNAQSYRSKILSSSPTAPTPGPR